MNTVDLMLTVAGVMGLAYAVYALYNLNRKETKKSV